MKASIIITSYNHKEFTIECIESCLNQDFKGEYEIIIVDDGSDDGSIEMIEEYSSEYPDLIKYYVMDRDDGVDIAAFRSSNAREKGLSLSSGEYILFLDGDDLITENKLSLQIDFLEKNKQYVACFTDFQWFWDDGKKQNWIINYPYVKNYILWSNAYIHLSCFVIRRDIKDFFISSALVDRLAVFSVLQAGKVYHIPEITFKYRQRSNSIIHSFDWFEKSVREVLFFQLLRNSGGLYFSTCAGYWEPLKEVFQNRAELKTSKYTKYFNQSYLMKRNYLSYIKEYDDLSVLQKIKLKVFIKKAFLFARLLHLQRKLFEKKNGKKLQEKIEFT